MTHKQIQLVQDSFARVVPIADEAAQQFYARLFTIKPALRHLFKTDQAIQGAKLMSMLSYAVARLEYPETLVGPVQELGKRHQDYGVEPEDYSAVGEALIWTLAQSLGAQWTSEVEQAWIDTYTWLSATMIAA